MLGKSSLDNKVAIIKGFIFTGMNSTESERGDGNHPPKKPPAPPEAQGGGQQLASQPPRQEPGSEESESDSDISIGEDLGEQLRLIEEGAYDSSDTDKPSNNNNPPALDPREGQSAQKEPKIVFSTLWDKNQVREAFSEQKRKKRKMKKVSFMCPVAKVISAVQEVHLGDDAQSSDIAGTSTQDGSGLNASDVVPQSGDTGATAADNHTVEPMEVDSGSDGANKMDLAACKARMASLRAELHDLEALVEAEEARIKAENDAAKAVLIREQIALSTKRKQQGLSAKDSWNGADQSWPNYNRKDKPMVILRSQILSFLSELGVPVEMASLCSWGTLSNVYGALMVGLHGAELIHGIDERLDPAYFTMQQSMRSVFTYVEWQVPAMVDRIREEASKGYKLLLGGKYLASVTLATSPTSHTPASQIPKKKARQRLKPSAMKAPHRRVVCKAPSSTGSTIQSDSSHVRQETEAPLVEPAVATSEATESSVPAVDRPSVSLEEAVEKPGEGSANPGAVGTEADNSRSDLRGEELRIARVTETKLVVDKWIANATKKGLEAYSKVDYNVLRFSLREKLKQAGLPILRPEREWAYARQVMDLILPAQRRAGHYKQPPAEKLAKRARQSTAQPTPSGKASRARQSTAQPKPPGKAKWWPKKKRRQNNNTASHNTTSSSAPAAVQRAPVSQDEANSQGRNRSWTRSSHQRGTPSPHKGSSSSSRKK